MLVAYGGGGKGASHSELRVGGKVVCEVGSPAVAGAPRARWPTFQVEPESGRVQAREEVPRLSRGAVLAQPARAIGLRMVCPPFPICF